MRSSQASQEPTPSKPSVSPSNGNVIPFVKKTTRKKGVPKGESDIERKRRKAREYYHAHKHRALAQKKAAYAAKRGLSAGHPRGKKGKVRKVNPLDALILINRALEQIEQRDWEGVELYVKHARRSLQGKE